MYKTPRVFLFPKTQTKRSKGVTVLKVLLNSNQSINRRCCCATSLMVLGCRLIFQRSSVEQRQSYYAMTVRSATQ